MNFCYNSSDQKHGEQSVSCKHHVSHHCIHSHSCNRKEHKRNELNENKKIKKGIIENDQVFRMLDSNSCQFKRESRKKKQIEKYQKIKKILQERQIQIVVLKKKINEFQNKLQKESQQKSDLNSQLNYYRQKFGSLIQSSNLDTKNQIKKRLSETTDLNFKIKSFQAKNRDLIKQNKELRQRREELEQQFQRLKFNYEKIVVHSHHLSQKMRDSQVDKKSRSEDWQKKSKQFKQNEENYKILIAELKRNCQKLQQNKKNLSMELQNQKISKKSNQKKYNNEAELNNIKINSLNKEVECLKSENQKKQKDKEQLDKVLKQMIEKNNELEEEIKHVRKLIQINVHLKKTPETEMEGRNVLNQKSEVVKETQNQEKMQKLGIFEDLKKQVIVLKEQIEKLKYENSRKIQEIILKIGPSEAFKRILEEKNVIIKQLMREKAQFKSTAILTSNNIR